MIRITCINCKAQLSIDDAFAGAVCRCQFCGTIQTVPKHLKKAAEGAVPAKVAVGTGQPRSTVKNKAQSDVGLSSGLDAIADAVASSGLSGSGLRSNYMGRSKLTATPGSDAQPSDKNKMVPILVGSGIVIVLLLGVLIGLLIKSKGADDLGGQSTPGQTASGQNSQKETSNTPPADVVDSTPTPVVSPKVTGPSFLGVKLNEPTVIFVLDRGSASHESLENMKMACLNAIDSFRPDQKYQIIFWKLDQDNEVVTIPGAPVRADNKAELKKTANAVDEITSFGQSDAKPALEKAFAAQPTAVVIASGKLLDEGFARMVLDARGGSSARVYCFSLAERSSSQYMSEVASKTGGTFKFVTRAELQSVTR